MARYQCIFEDAGTVARYGRLRHIPEAILLSIGILVYRLGKETAPGAERIRIADAGAGTGRFALPVAKAAVDCGTNLMLVAIDLSFRMLNRLREKWTSQISRVQLSCVRADLQDPLPLPSASVHVIYTVATFHILDRWRKALDNLVEALIPGGFLIFIRENNQFMHQTEGFDHVNDFRAIDPVLRDFMLYYHEQRALNREPYIPSELQYCDMMPAICYLRECGLEEIDCGLPDSHLAWQKPHTYDEILHCFRNKQMTTWGSDLTEGARQRIADALDTWVAEREINLEHEFLLSARLIPHIFQKPGMK